MKKLTSSNLQEALAALRASPAAKTLGEARDRLRQKGWSLDGREAVGLWLASDGSILPELVLLTCPSADYLKQFSLEGQRSAVKGGELFEVVNFNDIDGPPLLKRYDELTEQDCEVLFQTQPLWRELAIAIDNQDEAFFMEKAGKIIGFTRIHRDAAAPGASGERPQ